MRQVLLIVLITSQFSVNAQQSNYKDSIIGIIRTIRKEVSNIDSESKTVNALKSTCVLNLNDVLLRLKNFQGTYHYKYVDAVNGTLSFSKRIGMQDSSAQIKMLHALNTDIRIKFYEIPNHFTANLYSDLLKVKVKTLKNGIEIKNLRICYSSLGFEINYANPDNTFQQLSSPAVEDMVPGYYEIWVTEDGKKEVLQLWKGEISPLKKNEIQLNIQ